MIFRSAHTFLEHVHACLNYFLGGGIDWLKFRFGMKIIVVRYANS
jgi:hypothetical protein